MKSLVKKLKSLKSTIISLEKTKKHSLKEDLIKNNREIKGIYRSNPTLILFIEDQIRVIGLEEREENI